MKFSLFPTHKNINTREIKIRFVLGLILTFVAVYTQCYLILLLAIVLNYTAYSGKDFVYSLMGINKATLKRNELLSLLPMHNPEPVILFNTDGDCIFQNKPAKEQLKEVSHINDILNQKNTTLDQLLQSENQYQITKKLNNKTYLISFIFVPEKKLIMAYASDITKAIKAEEEIINTQKEVVYAIGEITETRSKETGYHVKRVAEYSALIAEKLNLPNEEIELIKMASPMHDIGKMGIPDSILMKPGKLTPEEWAIMQTHTTIGYNLLKHSERTILRTSAVIAKEHHEKYDGSGYPEGIKGKEIHLYARITAVADVFDALASNRVYKKAWPIDKIMALFAEEKGKHFDPEITTLLEENLEAFLEIRNRLQD